MPRPRKNSRRPYRRRNNNRKKAMPKKKMINSRRKIVELKVNSAINHTYQNLENDVTVLVPDSWMVMTQGYEDHQMIGNSLLTRYINHKMFLSFSNADTVQYNANIRVLCGWYKTPPNDVPHTESIPGGTRQGLYAYNPENVIKSAISNMLDNPLGTIDKKVFQITKDYLLKCPATATYESASGSVPTFIREGKLLRCSWTPNKKIKYLPATEGTTGAFTHLSPAGAPRQWIPFMCLYFGNNSSFPTTSKPTFILENHHYFTDS